MSRDLHRQFKGGNIATPPDARVPADFLNRVTVSRKKAKKSDPSAPDPRPGGQMFDARRSADDDRGFPIVGVGASAGGLEAFIALFRALPADTGMAFVLVPHLAPTHDSALAEILSRTTSMPVQEAADELEVQPNRVYVIPPGRELIIAGGRLHLRPRDVQTLHRSVDRFLRSLAEDQKHHAIGVILSGTATDGTLGLSAIKSEGGYHVRAR